MSTSHFPAIEVEDADRLVGRREAAKFLAVSERTLQRLLRDREIPFFRIAERSVRFRARDLEAYLKACAVGPR